MQSDGGAIPDPDDDARRDLVEIIDAASGMIDADYRRALAAGAVTPVVMLFNLGDPLGGPLDSRFRGPGWMPWKRAATAPAC